MCGAIIITIHVLHVIMCVVFKNLLLLEYRHKLFASDSYYYLWNTAVVSEMGLGLFSIYWTKCEKKEPDCMYHSQFRDRHGSAGPDIAD